MKLRTLLLVCLMASAMPAFAGGLYFMSDTPMSRFTEDDRRIFRAAAIKALEESANGERSEWGNPDTGAGGVIEVLDTVEDEVYGHCRRARVANHARGVHRSGVYRACRATTGTWRLLTAGDMPSAGQ